MPRPLTDRSLNAAKLEVPQPTGYPEAFQRLVDARNADSGREGRPRLYARDLHEEAIAELVNGINRGDRVYFLATPVSRYVRKTIWIDGSLKTEAGRLAEQANVTMSSFVLTAFRRFLEAHGVVQDAA